MTETSILPGAAPATDSGIDMVPPGTGVEESDSGSNRRNLMILGAIAGVIVLAAAAFMLLHKSSPAAQPFVPHSAAGAPSNPAPAHSAKPGANGSGHGNSNGGKPATLPKKAKHSAVRDPFAALVLAPVQTSGDASSTTTVTAPSAAPSQPPVGTVPTEPVIQPTDGGTQTTTPGNGGKTTGAPLSIQLKGVTGQKATFDVFYAHHKFRKFVVEAPRPSSQRGTVFDKIFALIGIQNGQVTIQIGDDTPFDLSTGISHAV
jgi:hypothetical protein